MKRLVLALVLFTTPVLAQQQQSVSEQVLQNMIGSLAIQNAKLTEQLQKLTVENEELKKQLQKEQKK